MQVGELEYMVVNVSKSQVNYVFQRIFITRTKEGKAAVIFNCAKTLTFPSPAF